MCGIFGYIAKHGRRPDLARLRRIAHRNRNGADATPSGSRGSTCGRRDCRPSNDLGPASESLARPRPGGRDAGDRCRTLPLGHARLARRQPQQPSASGGTRVARPQRRRSQPPAAGPRLPPRSNDALATARCSGCCSRAWPGPSTSARQRTAAAADGPLAILGVWAKPARLLVVRRGKPLSIGETDDGSYFGSLAGELPGMTDADPRRLRRRPDLQRRPPAGARRRHSLVTPTPRGTP
jgi:hypothetical protein